MFVPVSLKNKWREEKVMIWKGRVLGASPLESRITEGDSDSNAPILIDLTQDTDNPVLHTGQNKVQSGARELNCVGTTLRFTPEQGPIRCVVPTRGPSERCVGLSQR